MPLVDYVTYKAGFLPRHDAAAQQRCYQYLLECIDQLKVVNASRPSQDLENLISIYTNIKNLTEVSEGSQRKDKGHSFWRNWDRNKVQIISLKEDTDDDYAIQDTMARLEEGRYIEDWSSVSLSTLASFSLGSAVMYDMLPSST